MNRLTRLGQAGIKEGLYDNEALAAYLLYRLNALNQTGTDVMYPNSTPSLIDFFRSLHLCTLTFLVKRAFVSDTISTGDSPDRRRARIFRSFGAQIGHDTAWWGPRFSESRRLVCAMVERQGRSHEQPPEWLGPRL